MAEHPPALSPHGPERASILQRIGRVVTVCTAAYAATLSLRPNPPLPPPPIYAVLKQREEPALLSSLAAGEDIMDRPLLLTLTQNKRSLPIRIERLTNGGEFIFTLNGLRYACPDTVPLLGKPADFIESITATGTGGIEAACSLGTAELTGEDLERLAGRILAASDQEQNIALHPRLKPTIRLWNLPSSITVTIRPLDDQTIKIADAH